MMLNRDDIDFFTTNYKGYTFKYRVLDEYYKTRDGGKHFMFSVPVCEVDKKLSDFVVRFQVRGEDIDTAHTEIERKIQDKLDKV